MASVRPSLSARSLSAMSDAHRQCIRLLQTAVTLSKFLRSPPGGWTDRSLERANTLMSCVFSIVSYSITMNARTLSIPAASLHSVMRLRRPLSARRPLLRLTLITIGQSVRSPELSAYDVGLGTLHGSRDAHATLGDHGYVPPARFLT